ncbi:MCE family protein [Nocardioides sp. B-3]|uniref:MCE family protein n=1 Tax=Nocardioides sp. B-3 TaxID=2895565 RepID=UPI00215329BD|nr:MCE family protein [Nocardioides sp. B-3]UUZ59329.1 MCE family protein [Nocardioides sp. B-3]
MTVLLTLLVLATGCKFDGAEDLPLPGGPNTVAEEDGFEVTADFTDVLNVVPRTPVMVDDVPVGRVLEVERSGWHAEVTMRVRKDVVLPGSVIAEVRQTSLLGEKYIALVEPARDALPAAATRQLSEGDHIPLAQTGRNPEVEEVLGALSFLLSGGGVAQIKTISRELNAMMNGRSDELRDVLGRVESLVTALNGQKTDLIAAFDSVNELSKTPVDEKQVIADALDSMGPALAVLNEQHDAPGADADRAGRARGRRDPGHQRDQGQPGLAAAPPRAGAAQARRHRREPRARSGVAGQLSVPPRGRRRDQGRLRQRGVPDADQAHPRVRGRAHPVHAGRAPAGVPQHPAGAGLHPERHCARPAVRGCARPAAVPPGHAGPGAGRREECPVTRGVRIRLIAFIVTSAIGILYVSSSYLGLVDRVPGRGIEAHATLPTSGGLFIGSEVTYRGVKIGKVSDMTVTGEGLNVDLALDEETRLPVNSPMYVHNLSAVGEQYLDFEPPATQGPFVRDGDRLTGDAGSLPIGEDVLLRHLSSLIGSVDKDNLGIVVDELGDMFRDNATPLRSIVDNGRAFILDARANRDATIRLLDAAQPVLETQAANKENIRSFARDLALLTDTLAASDKDVRTVLTQAPATATEVQALVEDLRVVLPPFLINTIRVTRVLAERRDGLEQLLVTFPRLLAAGPTALADLDGQKYGRVNLNLNRDPPPCTDGYLPPSQRRSPNETSFVEFFPAECRSGAPVNMRGMKYAPPPRTIDVLTGAN